MKGSWRHISRRANFEPELVKQLVGRAKMNPVLDDPTEWNESEDPHQVSAGFFVYTDELDWEAGTIRTELFAPDSLEEHLLWDADDHLGTQFQRAEYKVELDGLHFPLDMIEMLLPNSEVSAPSIGASLRESIIVRPRKWG